MDDKAKQAIENSKERNKDLQYILTHQNETGDWQFTKLDAGRPRNLTINDLGEILMNTISLYGETVQMRPAKVLQVYVDYLNGDTDKYKELINKNKK